MDKVLEQEENELYQVSSELDLIESGLIDDELI